MARLITNNMEILYKVMKRMAMKYGCSYEFDSRTNRLTFICPDELAHEADKLQKAITEEVIEALNIENPDAVVALNDPNGLDSILPAPPTETIL